MPAIESKMIWVEDPKDPTRCRQPMNAHNGQCPYKEAAPGIGVCQMHGGHIKMEAIKQEGLRNYRLQKFKDRLDELVDSEGIKSLRDEVAIIRLMIEGFMTQCHEMTDVLLYAPRISDLVMRVEKLVVSCNRLEERNGLLLDRQAAITLAGKIVNIISQYVVDPEIIGKVANEIGEAIIAIGGTKNEGTGEK